jgi:lysyl-tRNA synthetase class 2
MFNPYAAGKKEREFYLTPSPEIWMKKLLAENSGSIFQITKSFRNSEQKGKQHNNEFTMLEWYTVNADYTDSILVTEKLLALLGAVFDCKILKQQPEKISVEKLFFDIAGIELKKCNTREKLVTAIKKAGFGINSNYTWEEAYNFVFVSAIEPALPAERPVFVMDYPVQIPCLAKKKSNGNWYERWELYLNGIEVANCYTEETSKENIDVFFKEQAELKKDAIVKHNIDMAYTNIFSTGFPECSGVALGIDRIVMVITGQNDIQNVISCMF